MGASSPSPSQSKTLVNSLTVPVAIIFHVGIGCLIIDIFLTTSVNGTY